MTKQRMLNSTELALLNEIVNRRSPQQKPIVESLSTIRLQEKEREGLRSVLAEELIEVGLGNDSEPNNLGKMIDIIIGKLMYY